SSLFNALLQTERSIVTHVPGTTRDVVDEALDIAGVPVVLVDTAGLRETSDLVEGEGVSRTRREAAAADLVLHLVDVDGPGDASAEEPFADAGGAPVLTVQSKSDLRGDVAPVSGEGALSVSALTGAGLDALREAIV